MRTQVKKDGSRTTVKHKHTYDESVAELIKKMQTFGETWGKRFADFEGKLQQLAMGMAKQIGVMFANVQALAQASSAHDASILAIDKVNLEIFGQLAQIDTILQKLTTAEQRAEWLNDEEIRTKSAAWYQHLTRLAFEKVMVEREERTKAHQEAVKKLAEEKAKAAEEKATAEMAKTEEGQVAAAVQQAEAPVVSPPEGGGQGADIPEGAQVFGG